MRKSAIIRLILFSVLAVVLIGILLAGIVFKLLPFSNTKYEKLETSIEAIQENSNQILFPASITDIRISWVDGNISVDSDDVPEITVTETFFGFSGENMVARHTDNQLMVLYQDENNAPSIFVNLFRKRDNQLRKDLHITVPTDWSGKVLVVDSASADLTVSGLEIEDVKVNSASSGVSLLDCRIGKLEVDSASSSVQFDGCLRELKLAGASVDGKMNILNNPSSIKVDSVSSDLELTLPEDCGFTVDKNGLGGSFSSEFETHASDDRHIHGNGECTIDLDGVSPTVKIHNSHAAAINW